MKAFHTYLNFDGSTREAMSFYQKCLDAKLSLQTFRDAKMDVPKGAEDRCRFRTRSGTRGLECSRTGSA